MTRQSAYKLRGRIPVVAAGWARAQAMGQRIDKGHELVRLAEEGAVAYDDDQGLPPRLAREAAQAAREWMQAGHVLRIRRIPTDAHHRRLGHSRSSSQYELVLERSDGIQLRGQYRLERNKVTSVDFIQTLPQLPDFNDPHVIGAQ